MEQILIPTSFDVNDDNLQYLSLRNSNNYDICVLSVGHEKCLADKSRIGPKISNFYSIHYVVNGKGFVTVNGKDYLVSKNTFFALRSNQVASYIQDKSEPWEYYWVTFSGICCDRLLSRAGFLENKQCITINNPLIQEHFEKMLNADKTTNSIDLETLAIFYKVFCILVDNCNVVQQEKQKSSRNYVLKAIEIVNKDFSDHTISTSSISKQLNIHQNYFSNIFKKFTNMPFLKYLTIQRLNKSCALIAKNSMAIKEVSESVGFEDPLYFSRIFKKYFKMSPSEYRNKVTK